MYTFMHNTQYLAPKWRAYVTPHDRAFVFTNGIAITSLWELKQALLTLDEGVIAHHIGVGHNHIADWVRYMIGDEELATVLSKTTQRWGMVVALERHMMRTLNLPSYVALRWLKKADSPFQFMHGAQVWSIDELSLALSSASQEALVFHYQRFPNDLSVWLADMVGDYYLADALEETNSKEHLETIVSDHLIMLHDAALA